ncbi:hypothetical protein SBADM41S_12177 [Streptomyces badius]
MRTWGWIPWISSRISTSAADASSCARRNSPFRGSTGFSSRARPSVMESATSRCCAPSCRSRSMRRRSASNASTSRIRDRSSSSIRESSAPSGGESRARVRTARPRATIPSGQVSSGSSTTPATSTANASGQESASQSFRTRASPSPPAAIITGVPISPPHTRRTVPTASASNGHSTHAKSSAYANSRQVHRSWSRVRSQDAKPGAGGSRCGSASGTGSISRSLRRSSAASGMPERTSVSSSGTPMTTTASALPAPASRSSARSVTAPRGTLVSR